MVAKEGSTYEKFTNMNHLLMKVERNQSIVFKFLKKLNSYRCEPTDYECFLQIGQLKHGLKELAAEQQGLLLKVNRRSRPTAKSIDEIQSLLERFLHLEKEIKAYLTLTKNHY